MLLGRPDFQKWLWGWNKAVLLGDAILITRVNRSSLIDSKVSLDARTAACDPDQKFNLYLERIDATRNVARYYALSIEPTLFGEAMLLRRWGRIGKWGRQKIHLLNDERSAVDLFLAIVIQKRARGHKPKSVAATTGKAKARSP